jgi:dienelactone hydrolase
VSAGRNAALAVLGALLLAAIAWGVSPYVRATSLVVEAAGLDGWLARATAWHRRAVATSTLTLQTRYGALAARLYRPAGAVPRTVVLTPGVHADGYNEPRLVGLARHLAAHGLAVLTPDLPDLKAYQVTPPTTDLIEDAAHWVTRRADLAADGRVGLVGISFGGGLSVVAAGRPGLRARVAFVLSFGGHGDFPRVLRYLCTGRLPDGSTRPPHDYGVVLILLGAAPRLVPPEQVAMLRRGILTFLHASHLDMYDKARAREEFARARALAAEMPEPARTLMGYVNTRDVRALGPILLPHTEGYGGDPALSPERSAPPIAPVYLLHGADDNVIPAMEAILLARHLAAHTVVHHLISPLITHAEVDRQARVGEVWNLIAFWARLLRE